VYGKAAQYFNPTDSNDIVRAIEAILLNPTYRDELIANGYKQVKKYSWRRMAEQTHAVYMNALKK
jgi:glycosyltransferase involved in cell wall biosynthesis